MESQQKKLCMELAHAESEDLVVEILDRNGLWEANEGYWINYGNIENNNGTISAQTTSPQKALVEKVTNGIDQILIQKCHEFGIDPKSNDAPKTLLEAIELFYGIKNGDFSEVSQSDLRDISDMIGIVATGTRYNPCITIFDHGTGQSPNTIQNTILSLGQSNKINIPFVIGTYNQGGSAALKFASKEHRLQLVITRQNPIVANRNDNLSNFWSFTIVRREYRGGKNWIYTYLAPGGNVLHFASDSLKLLPGIYPNAYEDDFQYGTFIKLFDYNFTSKKLTGAINMDLTWNLSSLLPKLPFPIRLFERRTSFKKELSSHSYEQILKGTHHRLHRDFGKHLEPKFPKTKSLIFEGNKVPVSFYVFKEETKNDSIKKYFQDGESLIYSINGQSHHKENKLIFNRNELKKVTYVKDDLFLIVDLSNLSPRLKADLLSGDRDGFNKTDIFEKLRTKIFNLVGKDYDLLNLVQERKEKISKKTTDDHMVELLRELFKANPLLANLLEKGKKGIKSPINLGSGKQKRISNYVGKSYPTFFTLKKSNTIKNPKIAHINFHQFRIQFKTDADNDFFERDNDPGTFVLLLNGQPCQNYSIPNLLNGNATLNIDIPSNTKVGDTLYFECYVGHSELIQPIVNKFYVVVEQKVAVSNDYNDNKRKKESVSGKGEDKSQLNLALPQITEFGKDEYVKGQNEFTALVIKEDDGKYEYWINKDNIFLIKEMLGNRKEKAYVKECFKTFLVLMGIVMINDFKHSKVSWANSTILSEEVERLSSVLAPMVLPIMKQSKALEKLKYNQAA